MCSSDIEAEALDSVVYIAVDTLQYLKKGGRITPAVAAIGEVLRIKPVLRIQGGKLELYKTTRTMKNARTVMLEALERELKETLHCGSNEEAYFEVAYSGLSNQNGLIQKEELIKHIGLEHRDDGLMEPLN